MGSGKILLKAKFFEIKDFLFNWGERQLKRKAARVGRALKSYILARGYTATSQFSWFQLLGLGKKETLKREYICLKMKTKKKQEVHQQPKAKCAEAITANSNGYK